MFTQVLIPRFTHMRISLRPSGFYLLELNKGVVNTSELTTTLAEPFRGSGKCVVGSFGRFLVDPAVPN